MNKDFFEYFNKCLNEDKVPHAFLIEVDNVEKHFEQLIEFLYNKKMIQTKDYINNINLMIVEPDGKEIKSVSINNLQKQFMTMPSDDKFNIYIIKYAEKLNMSSGNKLLKFLEEPESKILGILLSSNSQVLTTIKSRCQLFRLNDLEYGILYDEEVNLLINLLNELNIQNELELRRNFSNIDRNDLINIVSKTLIKLDSLLGKDLDKIQLEINSKKIITLDKILRLLKSNVNIDLVLDKLCIEVKD